MTHRAPTLAELALRGQVRAANRLAFWSYVETIGPRVGLMAFLVAAAGLAGLYALRLLS